MIGMSRFAAAFAERPDNASATFLCALPSLFRNAMGDSLIRSNYKPTGEKR